MSDWEDHEIDDTPVVAVPKKKWDDEDEDSDSSVPDNWEDSDEESEEEGEEGVEKKPLPVPETKPKTKKSLSERIAERQAEREIKKPEIQANQSDDDEVDEEDIVSRKLRERRMQVESDIQNTEDLFSGLTVKDTKINDTLSSLNPKTQADFEEFQKALVDRIQKTQNQRYYKQFLESFIRELALPLKDVDVRKFASVLTTLANEKQRAARDATKGKKKSKKSAMVKAPPKEQLDMNDYSRDYDDFDDFM